MRILIRIFAIIGIVTVTLITGLIILGMNMSSKPKPLPQNIVLDLDLDRPFKEKASEDPFSFLSNQRAMTLDQLVFALKAAADDPAVKGVVARFGTSHLSFAAAQEVRGALLKLKEKGKFSFAYSHGYGGGVNAMQSYYIASAFEQIWGQPMSDLPIMGMNAELMFLRGTLDLLKIEPQLRRREEYKSFAEQYMEKRPTAANLEMVNGMVGNLFDQWVNDVSANRSISPDALRKAIDNAPLSDRDAVEAKLIDQLGYWEDLVDLALNKATPADAKPKEAKVDDTKATEAEKATKPKSGKADRPDSAQTDLVSLARYSQAKNAAPKNIEDLNLPAVALIVGEGGITQGGEDGNFAEDEGMTAVAMTKAFDKAIKNDKVKAILFRVNSPGGSAVASQTIARKVKEAQDAGKPVIVSMAGAAASGGYWVSMGADRIVAQPGTITGSIGVVSGKFVVRGLTDMLGVSFTSVTRGANAAMLSANAPFTPAQEESINRSLDDIYGRFIAGVSEGRKLPLDKTRTLAKGRVYTGTQAKELGLVDALGGYEVALDQARDVLKLPKDQKLYILRPERPTPFELVGKVISGDVSIPAMIKASMARQVLGSQADDLAAIAPYLQGDEQVKALMPAMIRNGF
jgi:protease IV